MVVDTTDAVTLVLEFPANRKVSPAAFLALIFVAGWANSRGDGHPVGTTSKRYCSNHGVARRIDHRHGVGVLIRHVRAGSVRSDGHPEGDTPNRYRGSHCVARRVDHRNRVGSTIRYIGAV